MGMTFNQYPYFDDFDNDKKFYRILYRPSFAVQGRELTQSQSILQNQIKKFGDHIFNHGAMVIPGQITFDTELSYQKMVATYGSPSPVDVNPDNFLGYTIIGESSGVEGEVVNVAPVDSTDPLTFFLKFKDSGNDNESIGFWDGETIYRKDDNTIRATVQGVLDENAPTYDSNGKASMTSIDKGIYYIDGIFVDNDAQSIIVSKYDQQPSCSVGLRVYEHIVTSEDDISLVDNAQNTPNYASPGADRYKITLKLEFIDPDETTSDDFVILQTIENGILTKEIRTTDYSELEKTFARRTYDESGDYTVDAFSILMREHLRVEDGSNIQKEGAYLTPNGDETKVVVELGAGKGYVQGYEILKIAKSMVPMDKARDFEIENNAITNFSMGNYIKVSNVHNIPRIDEFGIVNLFNTVSTPGNFSGTAVGTARIRAIKRFGSDAYVYLFDITMNDGFSFEDDVKWIYDSNMAGTDNFTCEPTIEDLKLYLYKSINNVLIFKMPQETVKTLSVGGSGIDTNYQSVRAYFNTGIVANTATLVANDDEVFQQNTADYYVTDVTTGLLVSGETYNFTGAPTGKVLEIGNLSGPVNIIAPVSKTISTQATKELQDDGSVTFTVPNKKQNVREYLGKADGIRLKHIYMSDNLTTAPTNANVDIKDRYLFDTGQRDNYYDVCSITLKGGQVAPIGQIMVEFDYFTHTEGDYFSVDSYDGVTTFAETPTYDSFETGKTFTLADCLDFRPRMADDRSGFTGAGGSIGELPQVFTDIRTDFEYYVNRIDYVYLDYTGIFQIARGIPAIHPHPPAKPEMGMVLYEMYVPAYTFNPEDIAPSFKDNKRYTMRDIGDLDKRIGNLEYYNALSLLERETASMDILDQNGLNRFKNGFIVDPFDSHKVGDATHSDYNCAIDPIEKKMRAKFNDENIGLLYDEAQSTHTQMTGGIVTLPYTTLAINKQTQASKYENINPFAFRNIFGKISFNPASDVWHDKKTKPTLVVDHSPNYDALKFIADNTKDLNGIEWGRWNDVGGRRVTGSITSSSSSSSTVSRRDTGISHDEGWLQTSSTSTTSTTTTFAQDQTREGIQTTNNTTTKMSKSLGDRITDVSYIPYMRSTTVLIKSDQMKKKTKVYPFFDEIAMSAHCDPASINEYCTPSSRINISTLSGNFKTESYNEETIKGNTSGATALIMFQTDNYLPVMNLKGTFQVGETITGLKSGATATYTSTDSKILGDALITGDLGEIALLWTIPNDEQLKFKTGEREFILTDQITNADPVHTKAQGMFKSHGLSTTKQDTVLSTKTIEFSKVPVRQDKVVTSSSTKSSSSSSSSGWFDPIAQSFLINDDGGCFITDLDVYFQSKDDEEAVVCEIRNMINGYPAEIAMATTTVQAKYVTVSERAPGLPVKFTFPEPVYVKQGESYCFVLKPAIASASYNVWVAETGRFDTNTQEIITGKQSLGSLFKSQNASTWTPNQNEDIMFTLFKAKFDIASVGQAMLVNDEIAPDLLEENSLETYINLDVIRVYQNDHGMTEGSICHLSGCQEGNGILASELNGDHTVIDTEIDSFTFAVSSGTANATGLMGGTVIYSTRNYQLDVANPVVNEMLLDLTKIDWTLQTTTGQSVSGTQTPFATHPYIDVINKENQDMAVPMLIASKINEATHLSGEKSLKMIGYMQSQNENVSPVIDSAPYDELTDKGEDIYFNQSTSTLIAVANRIDDPSTETMIIGSNTIFFVGAGEDELVVTHTGHNLGTGAFIQIEGFTDTIAGTIDFDPNGLHEIRIIDQNSYIVDMGESSTTGYASGSGGGNVTLAHSQTHFKFVPESKSFGCSNASRYITKQVTLTDPAENIKLYFGAVRQQDADIDVWYKTRTPYEVTEWNEIPWKRIDNPDDDVSLSQSNTDFKDYEFTVEDIEPFNAISVKLVMSSTNSTQVPIFQDFRLICTT